MNLLEFFIKAVTPDSGVSSGRTFSLLTGGFALLMVLWFMALNTVHYFLFHSWLKVENEALWIAFFTSLIAGATGTYAMAKKKASDTFESVEETVKTITGEVSNESDT